MGSSVISYYGWTAYLCFCSTLFAAAIFQQIYMAIRSFFQYLAGNGALEKTKGAAEKGKDTAPSQEDSPDEDSKASGICMRSLSQDETKNDKRECSIKDCTVS